MQDIWATATAQLADVVLPSSVGWAECDGTVTSSSVACSVQAAVTPPGACRHDHEIIGELAKRMGVDSWGDPTPQELWDELRSLSPLHAGMSYEFSAGGTCAAVSLGGSSRFAVPARLAVGGRPRRPCPVAVLDHRARGPKELTDEFLLRLTTGRSLDSYNTGVQSGGFESPIRSGDELDMNPGDAADLGIDDGERVLGASPRGSVEMGVRAQPDIPAGLTFTTFHFPDLVDINLITNDEWDRDSGTAEFKAAAIRREAACVMADLYISEETADDIETAAVDAALDGRFVVVRESERLIRRTSAAWPSPLAVACCMRCRTPRGDQPGGLNYVCETLQVLPAEAYGVALLRLFRVEEPAQAGDVTHVCVDAARSPVRPSASLN